MKAMTDTKIFLADTYALIEILGGSLNYKPYMDCVLITTQFNLIELYYHLLLVIVVHLLPMLQTGVFYPPAL